MALLLHRLSGAFAGALLLLLCSAGLALAAGPAPVTFRAEGTTQTRVPLTHLSTKAGTFNKGGHSCSSTSAGGALEQATRGNWSGTYFSSFKDFLVKTIVGETHPGSPDSWTLWVNNKMTETGLCGTELQAGDDVLFFVDRCDNPQPPDYACQNPPVLPLGVKGPTRARRGTPFMVTVVKYSPDGTPKPTAGATVTGGQAPVKSGSDGRATVTLARTGTSSLFATQPNSAKSAPAPVCGYATDDGTCGTADRTPPRLRIRGIREGQVFAAGRGPRTLHGTVAIDASGLRNVQLRLGRRVGGRCYRYDARTERLRRRTCRSTRAGFFSVGDRADWSYLLPGRLPAGRYVFDAVATDKNGNRSGLKLGVSRVVFYVGSRR